MKVFGNKETLSKTASDLKEPLDLLPPQRKFPITKLSAFRTSGLQKKFTSPRDFALRWFFVFSTAFYAINL